VAGGITTYTNGAGIYSVDIAEGKYTVTLSATTYRSNITTGIIVTPGSTVTNNVVLVLTSAPIDQTITFGALSDKMITDAPFAVSATASSGLPVSFSIVSGPVTILGNIITITGTGSVTVRASQAGNISYNAAPNVDRTFNVTDVGTPKSSIAITSPDGGEKWKHGTTHTIGWSKTGSPGTNVKIELLKAGALNRVIIASKSGTSYSWTIPATQTPGTNYKIRITSTSNPTYKDTSDKNFIIVT
jgi:hypothetical protein